MLVIQSADLAAVCAALREVRASLTAADPLRLKISAPEFDQRLLEQKVRHLLAETISPECEVIEEGCQFVVGLGSPDAISFPPQRKR